MSRKLAFHLIKLMNELGVNRDGEIIGTNYKLDDSWHSKTVIYNGRDELISDKNFWGGFATRHMRKLKKRSEEIYRINEINALIERDVVEYLSKESEIQEALDDYKLIIEYKNKIQEIVKKWNGKFTSIFS